MAILFKKLFFSQEFPQSIRPFVLADSLSPLFVVFLICIVLQSLEIFLHFPLEELAF